MATPREENRYEGGGGFGKFRKRLFRKTQPTPYDRPPTSLRNPNQNNGWLSKFIDPAQRLITYSAHKLFSAVYRKRLPPPPPSETVQEATDKRQKSVTFVANESSGKQQGVVGESSDQTNLSDRVCLPELEKLLNQKTFTRSETDHLIELMRSRSVDTSVGEEGKRTEVVPLESMLHRNQKEEYPQTPALENRIENHLVSTPHITSSISVEDVASPAQLAKAYMESRPSKVSPSVLSLRSPTGEDSTLLKGHFAQKSPIMSNVPRATNHARVYENGFLTPRSRGRSAIYTMAQTPYPKVYPASTLKGAGVGVEDGPSSSIQHALSNGILSGSKQGGLKRRSSVLGNDIGSFGRIRRIRHKSNLLSSKGLTLTHSNSPLSITSSGVGSDTAQQPSSFMQKPTLSDQVNYIHSKSSPENVGDTMPSSNFPPLPSKSSEMASKILQQLDNMVSPKEKSSVLRLPNVNDNSPTKLSSSMLRGQALRSMEAVDSAKILDNVKDNELDGTPKSLSASAQKLTSKINKVENGQKPVSPNGGLTPKVTGSDSTVPRNQVMSIGKSGDSSEPPSKKWAFRMSAHEDYEFDDDAYPNEAVPPFSTSEKETKGSTAAAEKSVSAIEKPVQKTPPGSSVVTSSKSFIADSKLSTADGSIVAKKVDTPTSITSSIATDPTVKPSMGEVKSSTLTILDSNKSSSPNGSAANPPVFNFGNNRVPSTKLTGVDAQSKESTKTAPIFGLDKVAPLKETSADATSVNFGFNKNIDSVPQASFTFSSSAGGESTFFKFGGASDSKLSSTSSTTAAGVDSVPKVLESNNADVKASIVSEFSARSSEPSAASMSLSTSPANIFNFGNSSSQNNGSAASGPTQSSPFLPVVSNSLTSQNMFSTSSLATSSSSISAAATSTTSMTTSTPVVNASSNSSSSTSVMTSLSPATSLFKFGSTPLPSTSLPGSSSPSEPLETKSGQNAGIGKIDSTSFGGSSAAVGNAGNGIFGLSSLATSANSQSQTQGSVFGTVSGSTIGTQTQGSVFGTVSGSTIGTQTQGSVFGTVSGSTIGTQTQGSVFGTVSGSTIGTLAPSATSVFATSTQTRSVTFGSSAPSPLFGLTGSSSLSSSSPATNIFNSGTAAGQSTPASSSEANPVSSNNGTNSTLFGVPSWQPSKSSPFGTPFSSSSSSSSTSVFSFGTSAPSVASTSSPMVFGSSTGASGSQFSFTSAAATTNTQPAFGNSSPVFAFGSASVNNDQMSMEDSMAEDTVQATQPITPVFGQQPAQAQSSFVFGAPTPTGASPFQFGGQQNIAPQNPSPFQASGSLEFNAGGSFSLGTGGVDKSGRKHIKIKHRQRKK